jgi:hypothetical protein
MLDGPGDQGHDSVRRVTGDGIGIADMHSVATGGVNPKGREQANAQYDHDTHGLNTRKPGSQTSTAASGANSNLQLHQQRR